MVKISIIIPVYNSSSTLNICLSSIFNSDFKDFEVIIVDDCSTDNSLKIAKKYPCRFFSTYKNSGPAKARNIGVKEAKSDLILFLDSDTKVEGDSLRKIYETFVREKSIWVATALPNINSLRRGHAPDYQGLKNQYTLYSANPYGDYFTTQMGAVRKNVFDKIGGFDERFKSADIEDIEFGMRIPKGRAFLIKDVIIGHHFPYFGQILKNYFRRAIMLTEVVKKKKRLSTAHANLKGMISTILVLINFVLLLLSWLHPVILLFFFTTFLLFILLNLSLFGFAVQKRGVLYLYNAVFFEYVFSIAISSGGVASIILSSIKKTKEFIKKKEYLMIKIRQSNKIKVAVVNVVNKRKKVAMNKDLNGGFGTADTYSHTIFEKIIGIVKRRSIKLPVISLAFLMGIFKQKNISAKYYEGKLPKIEPEVILIYGSIVDYKNENLVCKLLKRKFKNAKIGFIGPFPSTKPELFKSGDFVIVGDFEYFFLKKFRDKSQLNGRVIVNEKVDMNELPSPELDGFPVGEYRYSPVITKKPFFVLQSSRGCPYTCSYYCVYGKFQGSKIRVRSPKKVVEDIIYLKNKYGMRGFLLRDPTFGIKKGYIEELCSEINRRNLKIRFGIETRMDLLDEPKIKIMFDAGLRSINTGIETINPDVARQNKRLLINIKHQERLIRYCERIGIKIPAFYLFGYEGDTKRSMKSTLEYAKKLNTFLARFAVYTPYPGTKFFEDLKKKGRIQTHDYEKYTQFNPVIRLQNLDNRDIQNMLSKAFKEYYFRPRYMLRLLKWKTKEFWL